MNSVTEQIKERLSIVDVVSTYTKLEKAGASFKARCPFHNERTPSFFVSPARQSYICFGCNAKGDIFTFIEEIEGLPFKEVLVMLAERAGVTLPTKPSAHTNEDDSVFRVLEEATVFYQEKLKRAPKVLEYLKARGLTEESISTWRIGYTGGEWSACIDHLAKSGFSSHVLHSAGISTENERGVRDRFHERIMFPLMNPNGKVAGFSGRLLPWITSDLAPKYLNSPESPVFHKSSYLYGYHRARKEIAKSGTAIVVEGQFDLIMAHQSGSENTVAGSGTAFTSEHARMLARSAEKIIFVMDADSAGIKASERAVGITEGLDVRIATLPPGLDPAECIRATPLVWKDALEKASHVIDFVLANIITAISDPRERIREAHRRLYPYLREVKTDMEREYFIKHIASGLLISEKSVRDDLATYIKDTDPGPIDVREVEIKTAKAPRTFKDEVVGTLIGIILWQKNESSPLVDIERIKAKMNEIRGQTYEEIALAMGDDEKEKYCYKVELELSKSSEPEAYITELLLSYEKIILEESLSETLAQLRNKETTDHDDEVIELLKKCDTLSRRIQEIKSTRLNVE